MSFSPNFFFQLLFVIIYFLNCHNFAFPVYLSLYHHHINVCFCSSPPLLVHRFRLYLYTLVHCLRLYLYTNTILFTVAAMSTSSSFIVDHHLRSQSLFLSTFTFTVSVFVHRSQSPFCFYNHHPRLRHRFVNNDHLCFRSQPLSLSPSPSPFTTCVPISVFVLLHNHCYSHYFCSQPLSLSSFSSIIVSISDYYPPLFSSPAIIYHHKIEEIEKLKE